MTAAGAVQKWQLGVVRTNCMDNLDRTNVFQSTLAKWSLNRQLRELGVLSEAETVDQHEQFMHLFRNSAFRQFRTLRSIDGLLQCGQIMQTTSQWRTLAPGH